MPSVCDKQFSQAPGTAATGREQPRPRPGHQLLTARHQQVADEHFDNAVSDPVLEWLPFGTSASPPPCNFGRSPVIAHGAIAHIGDQQAMSVRHRRRA